MKLSKEDIIFKQQIHPLFSSPVYTANAAYYENDVIDFDNIPMDEFYKEQVHPDLGDIGIQLISKNQNILLDKKYTAIKKLCDDAVHYYAYDNIKMSRHIKCSLTSSWMIVGYPGAKTNKHLHQNSVFSGIFYLKSGEDSGKLILSHPLMLPTVFSSTVTPQLDEYNMLNSKINVFSPKTNDIFIFPSHIPHEVSKNTSGEMRACIAFNYFLEGEISNDNTEKLHLQLANQYHTAI